MYIQASAPASMRGVPNTQAVTGSSAVSPQSTPAQAATSFGELLSDSLQSVNALQAQADQASARLALGDVQDVSAAMVSMQKAQLALELTTEVRNKLIDAYREIMRMPI